MKQIVENINRILTEWNPIGVPTDIAVQEYKQYIPMILKSIEDRQQLINYLESILINEVDVGYDPLHEAHVMDLINVSDKLMSTYGELLNKN